VDNDGLKEAFYVCDLIFFLNKID